MRSVQQWTTTMMLTGLLLGASCSGDAARRLPTRQDLEGTPGKAYVLAQVKPVSRPVHVLWGMARSDNLYQNWVDIVRTDAGPKQRPVRIMLGCQYSKAREKATSEQNDDPAYDYGCTAVLLAPVDPGRYRLKSYETRDDERKLEVPVDREFEVAAGKIVYLGLFSYAFAGPVTQWQTQLYYGANQSVTTRVLDDMPAMLGALELVEPGLSKAVEGRVVKAAYLSAPASRIQFEDPELQALWQKYLSGGKLTDDQSSKLLMGIMALEARKGQQEGVQKAPGEATEGKATSGSPTGAQAQSDGGSTTHGGPEGAPDP